MGDTPPAPPLPPHARRVFQGLLYDVYQWEQRLFDGSTTTFEAAWRAPTVQVLATTPECRIILLREEQPYVGSFTSVPGGRVERGDTPEHTVARELGEELGMQARELVLWKERGASSSLIWRSYDFVARGCRKVQAPDQEPGERIEPYTVTFEEFLSEAERPEFRNRRLTEDLFRMRHTTGALEAFRELLFTAGD